MYTAKTVELTELDLEKDTPLLAEWCQDPMIYHRVLDGHFRAPSTAAVKKSIEEAMKKVEDTETWYFFAVREIEKPEDMVGFVRLINQFPMHQYAEITFGFKDEETAQKFGSETLQLFLHYLFMEANFYKLEMGIAACETTLGRLLEDTGFTRDVVGREAIFLNGEYVDEYLYGMTRPEYRKKNNEEKQ
jgi:RimJ/RimL family protein N-acetyltransferase